MLASIELAQNKPDDAVAVLLVTDAYAKGWRARALPGSAQATYDVLPADYTLRGIPLAAAVLLFLLTRDFVGLPLPAEDRRAMFPAKIMERIYYHMLRRIRKASYNVFDRSVSLPKGEQFLIALKYWVKQRLFGL